MAYGADDPDDLLGFPAKQAKSPVLPSGPYRSKSGALRALLGDARRIGPGAPGDQSSPQAMLVDVEFDIPKVLLVTGQVSSPNEVGIVDLGGPVGFTIKTGLDRAPLDDKRFEPGVNFAGVFSEIVVARSVQVIATHTGGPDTALASVAVVQIDPSIEAGALVGLTAQRGNFRPDGGRIQMIPSTIVPINPVSPFVGDEWFIGVGQRAGFALYNTSAFNCFVALTSDGTPAGTTADFTCRVVPNGYYETPFGYSGKVSLVWDGTDAPFPVRGATITWLGYQNGNPG